MIIIIPIILGILRMWLVVPMDEQVVYGGTYDDQDSVDVYEFHWNVSPTNQFKSYNF